MIGVKMQPVIVVDGGIPQRMRARCRRESDHHRSKQSEPGQRLAQGRFLVRAEMRVARQRLLEAGRSRSVLAQHLFDHAGVEEEQGVAGAELHHLPLMRQRLTVAAVDVQRPGVGVLHLDEGPDLQAGFAERECLGRVTVIGVEQGRVGVERDAVGLEQGHLGPEHGVLRLRLLGAPERRQQLTELDEVLRLRNLADHRGVVADRGVGHPERHLRSGPALPKRCVAGVGLQTGFVLRECGGRVPRVEGQLAEVVVRERLVCRTGRVLERPLHHRCRAGDVAVRLEDILRAGEGRHTRLEIVHLLRRGGRLVVAAERAGSAHR